MPTEIISTLPALGQIRWDAPLAPKVTNQCPAHPRADEIGTRSYIYWSMNYYIVVSSLP